MEIQTQLPKVGVGRRCGAMQANLGGYRSLLSEAMDEELTTLAKNLKGIRICHVNSTAAGGGVAELLARYIPMLQALGVQADWRLIHGEPDFFAITKAFHNALPGGRYGLGKAEQDRYLKVNERSAKALGNDYDLYIVHDPQPAAIRHFAGSRGAKWIWRCHIDSSAPDKDVGHLLRPFLEEYEAVVFTMDQFVLPQLASKCIAPPSIRWRPRTWSCRPICAAASLRIPVWIRPGRCFCKSLALILGRIRSAWCMPIAWSKRTFPQCNSCSSAPWPGTTRKGGRFWIGWKRKPRTILICLCSQTCPAWEAWR